MTTEPHQADDAAEPELGGDESPEPVEVVEAAPEPPAPIHAQSTRISAAWTATGAALLLLALLVVFILQNQTEVEINFLWFSGSIPAGIALLISAVASGLLVAIAGVARVTQLRRTVRRAEKQQRVH